LSAKDKLSEGIKKEKPADLEDTEPSVKIWTELGKLDNINSLNKESTRV